VKIIPPQPVASFSAHDYGCPIRDAFYANPERQAAIAAHAARIGAMFKPDPKRERHRKVSARRPLVASDYELWPSMAYAERSLGMGSRTLYHTIKNNWTHNGRRFWLLNGGAS
jgi:hypothetical protein